MKMLRKAVVLWIALAIFFVPPIVRAAGGFSEDPDRMEAAVKSVLVLELYDTDGVLLGTASGFVAFDNKTLVTSSRAISGATKIVATSEDGFQYIIDKILISDQACDIAILGFFSPTDLAPLPLDPEAVLKRLETVVAIGSPVGLTNTVSVSSVGAAYEDADVLYIQFSGPRLPGIGGALFSETGAVVGLTIVPQADDGASIAVHVREIGDLYARWDGASATTLAALAPTAMPTAAPTAMPTAVPARTLALEADRLVWYEAGWQIDDPSAPNGVFTQIAVEDLIGILDFYADLTFSLSTGTAGMTDVVLTFCLYDGAALLDEMTADTAFGQAETQVRRYFDITGLLRGISEPGTYEIAYFADGDELGRRSFTVYQMTVVQTYTPLQYGDSGDAVVQLQQGLIYYGYLAGAADGVFGQKTAEAVTDFNLAHGVCVEQLYEDGQSYYDRDPAVAWNETLQLLYDGNPLFYVDPYMPLAFPDDAYAQWYYLDSTDELQIHFEVKNVAKYETVASFTLFVYATDYSDNLIYGKNQIYQMTTRQTVEPGEIVYSDYITIPYLSQIYEVHAGIAGVAFASGESAWLNDNEIDYWYWVIDNYN